VDNWARFVGVGPDGSLRCTRKKGVVPREGEITHRLAAVFNFGSKRNSQRPHAMNANWTTAWSQVERGRGKAGRKKGKNFLFENRLIGCSSVKGEGSAGFHKLDAHTIEMVPCRGKKGNEPTRGSDTNGGQGLGVPNNAQKGEGFLGNLHSVSTIGGIKCKTTNLGETLVGKHRVVESGRQNASMVYKKTIERGSLY